MELYKQMQIREQSHRDALISGVAPIAGGTATAENKVLVDRIALAEQSVTMLKTRCTDLEATNNHSLIRVTGLIQAKNELQLDYDQLKESYDSYWHEDAEEWCECGESELAECDSEIESVDDQPQQCKATPARSVLDSQQVSKTQFYDLDSGKRNASSTAVAPPMIASTYNVRSDITSSVRAVVPPNTDTLTEQKPVLSLGCHHDAGGSFYHHPVAPHMTAPTTNIWDHELKASESVRPT